MSRPVRPRDRRPWYAAGIVAIALIGFSLLVGNDRDASPAAPLVEKPGPNSSFKRVMSFADAKPVIDALPDRAPVELRVAPAEMDAAWTRWHNVEIRQRVERGDEDSIVNFWLYGTSFTSRPRATARDLARLPNRDAAEDLLIGRLNDLVTAMASPANERVRFARQVLERQGINPATPLGQEQARIYLVGARARAITENDRYRQAAEAAKGLSSDGALMDALATLYRERGLSSDTSITADFSLERALEAGKVQGRLAPGSVRRIAVVGPGLDFTDKAEGYDFYPLQTIQPFAVLDSLSRLGLSAAADVQLTTFDLSPRVNQHLTTARERARAGDAYVLQLPLEADDPQRQWHPDLVSYWKRLGDRIGNDVAPIAPPDRAKGLRVRAVSVRPDVVSSIAAYDVNIVVEQLQPATLANGFDLVIATNVLVYYDAFDQGLALANIAAMLRPGGVFLTNYPVKPRPPFEPAPSLMTKVFWDKNGNGDTVFGYIRR
jgi:SAM-dependent methyltransferase